MTGAYFHCFLPSIWSFGRTIVDFMSVLFRAASFAATSFCALAAMGAIPAQQAVGAPLFPPPAVEPLPPVPAVESTPGDGIATDVVPDVVPTINFPAHPKVASLAALVSRYADASLGDREADCLAKAVYFESKGEPLDGQLAVAEVIMNRAKSGRFASTLCGVVKQPSQFSFVRGGGFPPVVNQAMWREAVGVAQVAMNGLWESTAPNALYFHAKRVSPNWGKQRVAAVGNHIFYR
jgi:N-acetylmuramoyl-L-alanine amidase